MQDKKIFKILITLLFVLGAVVAGWRLLIWAGFFGEEAVETWADAYFVLALYGGITGLVISKYWGGFKSLLGKAVIAFSTGLFLQAFGQAVYAYYAIFKGVEAAYPSIGDFGYVGSVFLYIYGVMLLAKTSGIKISLRSYLNKTQAIGIPLILLLVSYIIFLRGYEFDWSSPAKIFIDFGCPLGQAVYVSIAILVLILSRNVLGGLLKRPILLLLLALAVQYLADFVFLYMFNQDTYVAGGIADILYFLAYFFMGYSLIFLGITFQRISSNN